MKTIDRRDFIRTGITGAAGMVALSPVLASGKSSVQENIIYRTLGRTGIKVPVVSFGVMKADNPGLCTAAYDNGIRLFDTAHGYQNGRNEEMLGKLLKAYPRKSFFLATKVRVIGVSKEGLPTKETKPEDFLEKFHLSLKRLQMDYVDILYMHMPEGPEVINYKPVVKVMKKLKKDGKTKFIGVSTHKNEPDIIKATIDAKIYDVVLTAYNFKQTYIPELNAAIKKAANAGLGVVAMKTMAGGGYLDKEKTKMVNTAAALKWALSNPDIHTSIPGMTTFDHLNIDLKVMSDITLSDQGRRDLADASTEQGLYCNGCSKCVPGCPAKLPVPELMRAYMYAYGYSNTQMARALLDELGTGENPCSSCESCTADCVKNFNVREKIRDISRLVNVPSDFLV